jgi:Amt family ammonium transporter
MFLRTFKFSTLTTFLARLSGPLLLLLLSVSAFAQTVPVPTVEQRLAKAEEAVKTAQMAGDNSWMLVSAALVLMMTGPGLALFYGGLVRPKNVLSTMMHSFIMMVIVTMLWAVVGYSLTFAEGNAFIGDFRYVFLNGVGTAPSEYAPTIPHLTWMVYQLMFAIITPGLISGAYAERIKFKGMLVFTVLWMFVVYFPMAHMVWGKGGLLNAAMGGAIPCLDFAGGTVVHITSGVSALVCALVLGKREGAFVEVMKPHSLVLSTVGACLLWVGWFGFNAGSATNASGLASSAFVATHFAAAAAALSWLGIEWIRQGKPSMLGGISGCVAGLVAITPASGFVKPMPAILIGLIAGLVCYTMVSIVKNIFKYDDSLDAFGVHGVGGTVGALLTGVFAVKGVNDIFNGKPVGMLDGNGGQLLNQAIGVGIAILLGAVGSFVILKIVQFVPGLRATPEEERAGLDLSMHGEEGYNLEA